MKPDRPPTTKDETQPASGQPEADIEAWQDRQVRKGIEAVKQGRFATPEQVRRVIQKYVLDG